MEDMFPELSDDNLIAFMQLEAEFRQEFADRAERDDMSWDHIASDYMNKTLAAAKALDIEALDHYSAVDASTDHSDFFSLVNAFRRDVDNVLIQIRVHYSRRSKLLSVGFTSDQKAKIHGLIDKIRGAIEASNAAVAKKEKLFGILAKLGEEVDKSRTGMERFGDLARGLASISRDVEEDGAEPWWKWAKLIFGIVDDAKEADPQLPRPSDVKRIEPPRKVLPKLDGDDDEIPF